MKENVRFIQAFVGGFMGPSYEVSIDLKDKTVTYKSFENGYEEKGKMVKHLEKAEEDFLLNKLSSCNILEWKKRYEPDYPVMDGTNWSVKVETEKDSLEKSGSNAYPEEWCLFCRTMEEITGKEFR
ncbi:hypothetical protein [Pseudalkalibacillus caeni]|uniref:Uncharacterized protein n=1 Tax=Exobacillus caeni TaxID=2574798 RepID=A0A5R9F1V9_9BACL|nr:hypothetical protein [Pseudalkalibacillus caeni]TLS36569.1 hypothetical protein FCL54_13660 [Pseudalkalibacillus caeni]